MSEQNILPLGRTRAAIKLHFDMITALTSISDVARATHVNVVAGAPVHTTAYRLGQIDGLAQRMIAWLEGATDGNTDSDPVGN